MSLINYKPHIDGMRAIAVVSVILYHLKIQIGGASFLGGGFLGVDLFFVLSGYLITKILVAEKIETGGIRLSEFYWRRSKRILPSLVLVILTSIPVAWYVLSPTELERFVKSIIASLMFLSNGFWFLELGTYGAQSGLLQPFLHTWSLAIEEQFYLLFPLLVIFLGGNRNFVKYLIILTICSLGLAFLSTIWNPEFSFFSPVSRGWELLAGSVLACFHVYHSNPEKNVSWPCKVSSLASGLAILIILVFFYYADLAEIVHPGFVTLPVVIAACVLIHFDSQSNVVVQLLSTRPMVHIGKLSYSLYLWHFPVFAFGRLSDHEHPSVEDYVFWLGATYFLSLFGYYAVEKPFRVGAKRIWLFWSALCASGFIVAFSAIVLIFQWDNRHFSNAITSYHGNQSDNEQLRLESWSILDQLDKEESIGTWNAHEPSRYELKGKWFIDTESTKVLIVGNSHSKDVYNAFALNARLAPDLEFARFGIRKDFPNKQIEALLGADNYLAASVVVIASRFQGALPEGLLLALQAISTDQKRVVLMGSTAEFTSPGSVPFFDWYMRRYGSEAIDSLNAQAYLYEEHTGKNVDKKLEKIAINYDAEYISRRNFVCNDKRELCWLASEDGKKTYYDNSHWTLDGARYFGEGMLRNPSLLDALKEEKM